MDDHKSNWFVGAYALTASLDEFSLKMAESFYRELATFPSIRGLELPIHVDDKIDDPWRHLHLLPQHFDYVLTPLPGVMQSLVQRSDFGLASCVEAGRHAALAFMECVRDQVAKLNEHCQRNAVRLVELHSAPTRHHAASQDCREALRASLDTLLGWDWCGAQLCIEHCDTFVAGLAPAKGFLDLQSEIAALKGLGVGVNINWARSVLEGRRVEHVHEQLRQLVDLDLLRGLFFSGITVDDPIYGSWLDNHAPMQLPEANLWSPRGSLLTREEVLRCIALTAHQEIILGLKVQAAPKSLSLAERLNCLQLHLRELNTHRSGQCD